MGTLKALSSLLSVAALTAVLAIAPAMGASAASDTVTDPKRDVMRDWDVDATATSPDIRKFTVKTTKKYTYATISFTKLSKSKVDEIGAYVTTNRDDLFAIYTQPKSKKARINLLTSGSNSAYKGNDVPRRSCVKTTTAKYGDNAKIKLRVKNSCLKAKEVSSWGYATWHEKGLYDGTAATQWLRIPKK